METVIISVLADAHFPTSSVCRAGPREVRADGKLGPVTGLLFEP